MSDSVEYLYKNHHAWLYGWLRNRLKQDALAADLAHDTFIKIIQHHERYSYEQPRALLTTIARNLANKWWQRKQIEQAYQDSLLLQETEYYPSPEQEVIVIQALLELSSIMRGLKDREKQVFILWQIEGLNYARIAEQLDVSLITVKRDMKKIMLCCLSVMDVE
ncbi:sigma-70 family RNA polymerase sigma factor [Acinetobacter sp. WZC-1]|uniref:sigma-70 family RNA polymerase sigma factor n=1 Tax=Acinetobacter sp. WZC-1 TaxID=3459034 RepID=UPI00403DFD18